MEDLIDLDDVARELRVTRRTVQKLARSGELPAITITRRGGFTYKVPTRAYFEWKTGYRKKKEENKKLSDQNFLLEEQEKWLEWCRNGALVGKPMSECTITKNRFAINAYWKRLPRRYRTTHLISVECLRNILSNIDPKMFATKEHVYKAILSFTKYLIKNNICESDLFEKLKELKPKRLYPPKKLHCTEDQFERFLVAAGKRNRGQSDYDMILNKTITATLGYTGLRVSELCDLKLYDVDLINGKMFVHLGKGKKNRFVGISSKLATYLSEYLKVRTETDLENFFITIFKTTGEIVPFTRHTINKRIKIISNRTGIEISPHGLRRTFATVAANAGKPINIISLALGHADLKTTQGYLMTSQDEVIKEMQGW